MFIIDVDSELTNKTVMTKSDMDNNSGLIPCNLPPENFFSYTVSKLDRL